MNTVSYKDLRQGDILKDGRVFFQQDRDIQLLPSEGTLSKYLKKLPIINKYYHTSDSTAQMVSVNSIQCNIAIISQSCDIMKSEYLLVAPVIPLPIDKKDFCGQIKNYRLNWAFYLPAVTIPENLCDDCYVDLRLVSTMCIEYFDTNKVIRRLTDDERIKFGIYIKNRYTRLALEQEIIDTITPLRIIASHRTKRIHIHSVWINIDNKSKLLSIIFVLNSNNKEIEREIMETADEISGEFSLSIQIYTKNDITLAMLEDYEKFAWDNLSFK